MRFALDAADHFPRLFGQARPLAESIEGLAGTEVPKHRWIHVASEGMYRGHWQGAFELTRAVFESFVSNLHAHPQYKQGTLTLSDGVHTVGVKDTIQFDYEHASEMQASEGTIPVTGAPAPAWVTDVDVRDGADGKAQLWAMANLGDQIRGQISRNEYRFVSIAFDLKAVNWVSGEPQGPTLTSIAFTNHPFLRNLESYAAANRRPGQVSADQLQPEAPGNEAPAGNPAPEGSSMNASAQADFEKFRTRICSALSLRVTLADDAVVDAAAEAAKTGGGLKGILESLGVADGAAALKVIPELVAARGKLADTLSELDQLLQGQVAAEAQMADGDVAAVLSAKGWKDDVKRPLLAERNSWIQDSETKAVATLNSEKKPVTHGARIAARAAGRDAFLKEYGAVAPAGVDTSQLTQTLAAGKGGQQVAPPAPGVPGAPLRIEASGEGGDVVDLRQQTGLNPFDKVLRHLDAKDPTFKTLPHFTRCQRAAAFQSSNQILL